jgi:DNA-binding NarL/FixJ family response regulator
MIKLVIADDQLLFRTMLEEIIRKDPEFTLVGSASNGEEAVSLAAKHTPDVVLLDIQMPKMNGIFALEEIKSILPSSKVLMLTTFEDGENITSASLQGADGYLVKDIKPDVLLMAIKCAYHDIVLFHQGIYEYLFPLRGTLTPTTSQKFEYGNMIFDAVDIAIMKQIAFGKSNKEIAKMLNYSEGTIKNRISKLLSTLGFSDRTEISVFAIKNEIV